MFPYKVIYKLRTFRVGDSASRRTAPRHEGAHAGNADEAARLGRAIFQTLDADKEHSVVLCLNTKNRVMGFKHISTGTLTNSLVRPREVFIAALELRAAGLILVHNHPSGDPTPSLEDLEITRRLEEAAELLGFRLLDHIILGRNSHYSFQTWRALESECRPEKPKRRPRR